MRHAHDLASLKLVRLTERELGYIAREADAVLPSLAPATLGHIHHWEQASFFRLRQARIFFGLRASSRQHNQEVWTFRGEWAFPRLDDAKQFMQTEHAKRQGYVVRVLELPGLVFECAAPSMLVVSLGRGAGQGEPGRLASSLQHLVGLLTTDTKLLARSRPITQLKRETIDHLLAAGELAAWAVPPGAAWRVPQLLGTGHRLHTLGKGGIWEHRSITVLPSDELGSTE